jgi:pimeloyl-ACP methyl ester carboxylesterase
LELEMKRENWGRAARGMAALLFCAVLGGCGLFSVSREAKLYRAEMAEEMRREAQECRSSSSPEKRHVLDHRYRDADASDCYSAVISSSSRQLEGAGGDQVRKPAMDGSPPSIAVRKPWTPEEMAQATSAAEVLGQVAWPAVLSKVVYRRYAPEANRGDCVYKPDLHPLERLKTVSSADAGNWERWKPSGVGCKAVGGLYYETFVHRLPGGAITQAFIVFRGTENYSGQFLPDWEANLAMALNLEPQQFMQARAGLKEVIEELKAEAPGVEIYTAGHSLGGSMAQLAAYISKDVKIAYAFNTSPVSGWTWLRKLQHENPGEVVMQRKNPPIIRVMQDDEALGFVRVFSNAANSTVRRSGRTDVALDFPSSRDVLRISKASGRLSAGVALHSITLLACNLTARVANGAPGAFGFTREQAKAVISERDGTYSVAGAKSTEGLCQVIDHEADCTVNWTGADWPTNCRSDQAPSLRASP